MAIAGISTTLLPIEGSSCGTAAVFVPPLTSVPSHDSIDRGGWSSRVISVLRILLCCTGVKERLAELENTVVRLFSFNLFWGKAG